MSRSYLMAVGMALCVLTAGAGADDKEKKADKAKLIVGKWEVTKASRELPVGAGLEFLKDGKFTVTLKEKSASGTYKIADNKLQITIGDDNKAPVTIKKLSKKE